MDEDAPDYRLIVHNPMDMATLLQRVDCGHYLTRAAFLRDFDLIVANAKVSSCLVEYFAIMPLYFFSPQLSD